MKWTKIGFGKRGKKIVNLPQRFENVTVKVVYFTKVCERHSKRLSTSRQKFEHHGGACRASFQPRYDIRILENFNSLKNVEKMDDVSPVCGLIKNTLMDAQTKAVG